ncbi:hypothetical protein BKA59DRAFT_534670 [Fusarium tricinctum]|uniref:Uncharacterized protein n=1 Tax=Fusarium tricinctum TaxID=61284 RepID=A0A8K0RKF7_9HYPO|nr:hypothetical protein BKA59DRAFT_534670 [Fusarium tricinctum]
MDAEWQYNLLEEDTSLTMDLNDPLGSVPPEMDLSHFHPYQPADDTVLTMGDPLLGLTIAFDECLPEGAYPDFLADVTSRTDNSFFPNTDCPTTFDGLFVSDVLGSSQNSMDYVTFPSGSSLSPGFESTIISPCSTRSPALWHSPGPNYMRNNIFSSSSAHQYSPFSSATLSTSTPSIPINESSLAQQGKATRGQKSPFRTLSRDLRHILRPEVCHLCFKRHPYTRELKEHIKVHHPAEASELI